MEYPQPVEETEDSHYKHPNLPENFEEDPYKSVERENVRACQD